MKIILGSCITTLGLGLGAQGYAQDTDMIARIKNTIQSYESSHSMKQNLADTLSGYNGFIILRNKDNQIIKEGEFLYGKLWDGIEYEYSSTGRKTLQRVYKNGRFVYKETL